MLDSESEVCAYKGPYISLSTQTGAIQLLMKTGDPSGQRTQELEASKEQSDCSYLVQTYDSQKRRAFTKVTKTSRTSSQISVFEGSHALISTLSQNSESLRRMQQLLIILLQNLHTGDQSHFISQRSTENVR
jgi:hypothetical protein